MDLIKSALGMFKGQTGDIGNGGPLLEGALALLQDGGRGGLQGVVQAFKDKGLGEAAASWVGTGANLPISANDVMSAIGSERVEAMAKSSGLSVEATSGQLASLLPKLIDSLTPNGQIPEGDLLGKGFAMLKGKIGL